jgi:S-adenosylmethionine decarboxylase
MDALSPLEMVSDAPIEIEQKDYFVEKDGLKFAGASAAGSVGRRKSHRPALIDGALRDAAEARAMILHSHFPTSDPMARQRRVRCWREVSRSTHSRATAVDIFMCGACNPHSVRAEGGVRAEVDPAVRHVARGDRVISWRPKLDQRDAVSRLGPALPGKA